MTFVIIIKIPPFATNPTILDYKKGSFEKIQTAFRVPNHLQHNSAGQVSTSEIFSLQQSVDITPPPPPVGGRSKIWRTILNESNWKSCTLSRGHSLTRLYNYKEGVNLEILELVQIFFRKHRNYSLFDTATKKQFRIRKPSSFSCRIVIDIGSLLVGWWK